MLGLEPISNSEWFESVVGFENAKLFVQTLVKHRGFLCVTTTNWHPGPGCSEDSRQICDACRVIDFLSRKVFNNELFNRHTIKVLRTTQQWIEEFVDRKTSYSNQAREIALRARIFQVKDNV